MITTIEVTAEDIATAKRGSAQDCPIALAANRAFSLDYGCVFADDYGDWKLQVYEQRYDVIGGGLFACYFDSGRPVEPEVFRLDRLDDAKDEDD